MAWQEHIGALHVHSRYSDGSGTVEEILCAARRAGLDHVVLADHDTLAAAREGWSGERNGVRLVVAAEITPKRQAHVLALRVEHCEGYAAGHNDRTLDDIVAQGGYALVAHPLGKRKAWLGIRQRPWYNWDHPAIRGMEVWSYTHDWVDGVAWWRLPEAYSFWRHPEEKVRGPHPSVLAMWDEMGRTRRLAGWGGIDCHARPVPLTGWKVFEYERMFRFLRNHLFIEEADYRCDQEGAIWSALEQGRGFLAHDALADSTGARCGCLFADGRLLQMGEDAPYARGAVMTLTLPEEGEIRWLQNGRCRLTARARVLHGEPAGPGVYRFEVFRRGRPWLFTNPFYLR